jgi:putative FmdB family regulatory protein
VAVLPVYQYKCEKCDNEFELRKSFSDDSNHVQCPKCGEHAERVFVPSAIIFKGSGFYVTDYKAKTVLPSVNKDKPKENKESAPAAKAEKTAKAKDSKE